MIIEPGVHLLASGALGLDLSDPFDCNVYLFTGEFGSVLFDAGVGRTVDQLLAVAAADGVTWRAPVHLFLTHGHADHSGGAALLEERLDTRIHAGALTAQWLEAGDETAISLSLARDAGVYPSDYRWRACRVDEVVEDGSQLSLRGLDVLPIATPGHSADHLAYLVTHGDRRWLISGDALFRDGMVTYQATWDCDLAATGRSLRRLGEFAFDALLPGHGGPSLNGAHRHVEAAVDRLDRLLCARTLY